MTTLVALTRPEIGMTYQPGREVTEARGAMEADELRLAIRGGRRDGGETADGGDDDEVERESAHRFLVDTCEAAHKGRAGPSFVPASARQAETRAP